MSKKGKSSGKNYKKNYANLGEYHESYKQKDNVRHHSPSIIELSHSTRLGKI
jgi:hypothetical protein